MASAAQVRNHNAGNPSFLGSGHKQKLVGSLLLVLATLALYNPVTRAPFFNLDDDLYVTENPNVQAGLSWHSVEWAFGTFANTNWHPLTWLSHELDCQVFGLNPAGPHMVNVLLHAANAVLLFLVLAGVTGATWRSLMVAALFALHPINVESVAWIAERKNVLSMLFFLLALAAYGGYVRRRGVGPYLGVTVLYALALMAKPQVITFPFALLLLDYWPLQRMGARAINDGERVRGQNMFALVLEKIPWFALSAASAIITMTAQSAARHEELPLWERLANAALAYAKYMGKTFWPENLAPLYPHPGRNISIPTAALSALALIVITVLVVIFRERRYLLVGWLWFLGTMVPMIGLVQVGVQAMADRYAYIPMLGIFAIVCWGVPDFLESLRPSRGGVQVTAFASASMVVLMALSFALHRQVSFWTDNFALWRHTLDITQANFIAEDSAANALMGEGKTDEAMEYFRRANAVRPLDPVSTLNIASYAQQQGDYQAAIAGYQKLFDLTANATLLALAHTNEGYAFYAIKNDDASRRDFTAALQLQPENAAAYVGLGQLALRAGDWTEAVQDFERATQIQPSARNYELLAQALDAAGKKDAADAARVQALKIGSGINQH